MARIPIVLKFVNPQVTTKPNAWILSEDSEPVLRLQIDQQEIHISKTVFKQPGSTGGGGGTTNDDIVVIEKPTEPRNGVNTTFSVSMIYDPDSVEVYLNGMRQDLNDDYFLDGVSGIEMIIPPGPLDKLTVQYSRLGAGGISSSDLARGEVPSGAINGSNAVFTTAFSFIPETVEVYINGMRQDEGDDYVLSGGNTITFMVSPVVGDDVAVDYLKA